MSYESDESQAVKPNYLVFILAIAGRIDAQIHIDLNELDTNRLVRYGYAALDSLSSSYSMFKYFFDVFSGSNDPDFLHDVMLSPLGIAAITIEAVFLVTFSVLAVHFEKEKQDEFKKFIAAAWPYFRDVMKGLKNAYKGLRSTFGAIALLGGTDLKYLATPLGLALGVFAAVNRVWIRKIQDIRKTKRIFNIGRLLEFKKLNSLSHQERLIYWRSLEKEKRGTQRNVYAAITAGALIDSLYLYVGVLSLSSMMPPLFIAMTVACVVFSVAWVLTRLYEEYEEQRRLSISRTKCKLALLTIELKTNYAQLLLLQKIPKKNAHDIAEIKNTEQNIFNLIEEYEAKRKKLKHQLNRTYFTAALYGMRNGLYGYNVLASVLFLIGAIYLIVGTAFPPWYILSFVAAGLILMAALSIHSLIRHYQDQKKQNEREERSFEQFTELKNNFLKGVNTAESLDEKAFKEILTEGVKLDKSPKFFFQEWFEVFRSFFSGLGKGQRFVDFAGNFLQEQNAAGHYQDTPIMYVLSVISALFFGLVLALRAWIKGFDRTKSCKPEPVLEKKSGSEGYEHINEAMPQIQAPRESIQPVKTRTDSQASSNKYSFFGTPSASSIVNAANDIEAEQKKPSQGSIIQGLM